jgi:hypothetical protein
MENPYLKKRPILEDYTNGSVIDKYRNRSHNDDNSYQDMQIIGLSQQKMAKPHRVRNVYGISNRPSRNNNIGVTLPNNQKSQLLPAVSSKILSRNDQSRIYDISIR